MNLTNSVIGSDSVIYFGFEILDFLDNLDSEYLKYGLIKLTTFWRPLKFHWVNFDLTIKAQIEIICLILYFELKGGLYFLLTYINCCNRILNLILQVWYIRADEFLQFVLILNLWLCCHFDAVIWTCSGWNLIVICFDDLRSSRILHP